MGNVWLDPNLFITFAVLAFLVPLPWLLSWVVAVCFHELCHLVAVRLCGGSVSTCTLRLGGAIMESTDLSDNAYIFSVLAGPVGGLVLVLLGRWFPRLAICSWVLSVYNLIPILPLDGGQAIRILIKNEYHLRLFQNAILIIISAMAVYVCFFLNIGPLTLFIPVSLWIKNRKIPCKETKWGVQ